jgi:hypothetical protein
MSVNNRKRWIVQWKDSRTKPVFLRRQAFYKDFLASLWLSGNLPLQ